MLSRIATLPNYLTITDSPLKVVLFINLGEVGWSEFYCLPDITHDQAYERAQLIALYRSWLLAKNCKIEWVCLRQESPPWWEWPAIGASIPDIGRWDLCHVPQEGILINFRTEMGRYNSRFLRGIPFDQYVACKLDKDAYRIPNSPLAVPDPLLADWPTLFKWFNFFLRQNTVHADPNVAPFPAVPHPWKLTGWSTTNVRGVRTHDIGPAVARVSWEPDIRETAPPFTPCGMAVTVLRACYQSRVRFFTGGPVQKITYYYAKPGVDVFQHRHIFWGWRRDMDTRDLGDPGELVQHRRYLFAPGFSFGDAPGDHYCGLLTDFLGLRVWPPAAPLPAEITCLAGCDVPVPLPIKFRLSDNSVIQPDTQIVTLDVADFTAEEIAPNEFVFHAKCGCDNPCNATCTAWTTDVPWATPANPFALKLTNSYSGGQFKGGVRIPGDVFSPKVSIGAWVKAPSLDPSIPIIGLGTLAGFANFGFHIQFQAGFPRLHLVDAFDFAGNRDAYTNKSDPITLDGNWHHYGVSIERANGANLPFFYVDGVPLPFASRSFSSSSIPADPNETWIGQGIFNTGFEKLTDDVRVYDAIIGSSEFANIFARTPAVTPAHYYPMDEGEGIIIHDTVGTMPGFIEPCFTADCLPTGVMLYGATVLAGKVIGLGSPITEIICDPV